MALTATVGSAIAPGSFAMVQGTLYITGNAEADGLLNSNGTALLIGMLLDQQVPMEWAFAGPATLRQRLGHLDAGLIAAMDVEDFVAVCCAKPAIHRFPASMGRRIHELCRMLADDYGGEAENVWRDVTTGDELYRRLRRLPGYGDEKSKIFVAILAKSQGVAPAGLARGGRQVRRRRAAVRRRHPRPGSAGRRARVEEGAEGGQAGQAGPPGLSRGPRWSSAPRAASQLMRSSTRLATRRPCRGR